LNEINHETEKIILKNAMIYSNTFKSTVEKNPTFSSTPLLSCDSATLVLRKISEFLIAYGK